MGIKRPRTVSTVRLNLEESKKLEELIKSGLNNKQLALIMPRLSIRNIYNMRAKLGLREYKKFHVTAPVQTATISAPAGQQLALTAVPVKEAGTTATYNFNGVNVQVSKTPKSITIKDNSFTLEF